MELWRADGPPGRIEMKKSFLAVALAAAFTTLTFAQSMPPSKPSQGNGAKKTHKSKKHKKATKTGSMTAMPSK